MSRYVELLVCFQHSFFSCLNFYAKDKTPLERAEILSTTSLFAKINTETASSELNETAPELHEEPHFTRFM